MGKINLGLNFEVCDYCIFVLLGKQGSRNLLRVCCISIVSCLSAHVLWTVIDVYRLYMLMFTVVVSNCRLLLKGSNIECLRSHWLIFKEMRIMRSGRLG